MLRNILRPNRLPLVLFLNLFLSGMLLQLVPIQAAEQPRTSADLSTVIIQVAKQNIPAVVHIEVTERQEVVNPFLPFELGGSTKDLGRLG